MNKKNTILISTFLAISAMVGAQENLKLPIPEITVPEIKIDKSETAENNSTYEIIQDLISNDVEIFNVFKKSIENLDYKVLYSSHADLELGNIFKKQAALVLENNFERIIYIDIANQEKFLEINTLDFYLKEKGDKTKTTQSKFVGPQNCADFNTIYLSARNNVINHYVNEFLELIEDPTRYKAEIKFIAEGTKEFSESNMEYIPMEIQITDTLNPNGFYRLTGTTAGETNEFMVSFPQDKVYVDISYDNSSTVKSLINGLLNKTYKIIKNRISEDQERFIEEMDL